MASTKQSVEGMLTDLELSALLTAEIPIERLSAFTEFYLKPLLQSLPSFVKDSTDFINKLEDLMQKAHSLRGPYLCLGM